MKDYTWNDLKVLKQNISLEEDVLENSNIILFGAGMNGSFTYERIKNQYPIVGFSDNSGEAVRKLDHQKIVHKSFICKQDKLSSKKRK